MYTDIGYDDALLVVRTSPNIYHAGLSGYVIFQGQPTDYENKCVDFLIENHGYEIRESKSFF